MAETISMPKLGFDMSEGVLVHWVKNEGENINKGDVLAEIETDKATVEVESSAGGVVRKLLASEGDVVPVGAAIAIVGTADEKIEEPTEASGKQKEEPKAEEKAPAPPPSGQPRRKAHPGEGAGRAGLHPPLSPARRVRRQSIGRTEEAAGAGPHPDGRTRTDPPGRAGGRR